MSVVANSSMQIINNFTLSANDSNAYMDPISLPVSQEIGFMTFHCKFTTNGAQSERATDTILMKYFQQNNINYNILAVT